MADSETMQGSNSDHTYVVFGQGCIGKMFRGLALLNTLVYRVKEGSPRATSEFAVKRTRSLSNVTIEDSSPASETTTGRAQTPSTRILLEDLDFDTIHSLGELDKLDSKYPSVKAIFVTLKDYTKTPEVMQEIADYVNSHPDTVVIDIQNGLPIWESPEWESDLRYPILQPLLESGRYLPMVATNVRNSYGTDPNSGRSTPAILTVNNPYGKGIFQLDCSRLPEDKQDTIETIQTDLKKATIDINRSNDPIEFNAIRWYKLLVNQINLLCAFFNYSNDDLCNDRQMFNFFLALVQETIRVANADLSALQNKQFPDQEPFIFFDEEPITRRLAARIQENPDYTASAVGDLHKHDRKQTEREALAERILDKGRFYDIEPTSLPCLTYINEGMKEMLQLFQDPSLEEHDRMAKIEELRSHFKERCPVQDTTFTPIPDETETETTPKTEATFDTPAAPDKSNVKDNRVLTTLITAYQTHRATMSDKPELCAVARVLAAEADSQIRTGP